MLSAWHPRSAEQDEHDVSKFFFFVKIEMHSFFKATILGGIERHEATRLKRRPATLDPDDAVSQLCS